MAADPDDLPRILRQICAQWLHEAPILSVEALAYLHVSRQRPRSSPMKFQRCAGLIAYVAENATHYLLVTIYRAGKKDKWDIPFIECGDRFRPPPVEHQFLSVKPVRSEIDAWLARIRFFEIDPACESLLAKQDWRDVAVAAGDTTRVDR